VKRPEYLDKISSIKLEDFTLPSTRRLSKR